MSERPSAREQSLKGFVQDTPPSVNFSLREAPLQKELFTLAECATILSLGERTVEALVSQGYLKSGVAPGTGSIQASKPCHARRLHSHL